MTHQSSITFADIWAEARARTPHLTDAEFDYLLAFGDGVNELANAAYIVANQHLPSVTTASPAELSERAVAAHDLIVATKPEREAAIVRARARRYIGWSDAARGLGRRIEYADTHVTVVYNDVLGCHRVVTFKAGDSIPVLVLKAATDDEVAARKLATSMAAAQGLTFFEWTGEAP